MLTLDGEGEAGEAKKRKEEEEMGGGVRVGDWYSRS